jgi:hypothetical protein
VSVERLLSTLICGTCRPRDLQARHPSFPSTTWIESQVNEAARTRLYGDTRSHLCGSDSSAARRDEP